MRIGRLRVCKERGDVRRRRQTGKWKVESWKLRASARSAVAACSVAGDTTRRASHPNEGPLRCCLMSVSHACKRPSVYCTQYVCVCVCVCANQYVEGNGGCPGRSFRIVSNLNPVTDRNDRQRRQTPRSNRSETDSRQRRASHQADRPLRIVPLRLSLACHGSSSTASSAPSGSREAPERCRRGRATRHG